MKFGKHIQQISQDWATPYYISYKDLKKIIKQPNPKTLFFYQLERELEKVNGFYELKVGEFGLRLDSLEGKMGVPSIGLREAFIQFQLDLQKLSNFITTNQTGFRKILKKYDKQLKANTKEIYLSRKIDVQPIFNKNVLAGLEDRATKALSVLESVDIKGDVYEYIYNIELLKSYLSQEYDTIQLSRVFLERVLELDQENVDLLIPVVDLNVTEDSNNYSCLHKSVIHGRFDLVSKLVEKSDVALLDFHQRSVVHYSCMYGHYDILKLLLTKNVDLKSSDQDGLTPLIYAIMGGFYDVVELLLEKIGVDGSHALSVACQYGHVNIVSLLLSKNLKIEANQDGLFPLHIACKNGHAEIVKLLIAKSNLEEVDLFNGWTALFFASSEGNVECLQVLLENGCRVHVKDDIGWNALTYALYRGKVKAAELISMYLGKDEDVVMVKQKSEKSEGELDLDDIPSLSLPPPIIPLRIYGHHYLDHKILLQIELGGYENSSNVNSLRLKGSRQYGSYKLKISVKPEREMTFFVNIPLKDKVHVFSSTVESLDAHEIEFELVPSFGTKPIARGVFSNSQCKEFYASQEAVNGKEFFVPLLDWGLVNIGEVSFRTSVVKPFVHDAMSIGGTIETYWKSTTQTSTGDSMHSLVTGSSLAKEFVELTCQTTKDGIVVVYDDWFVRIGSIPIPIYSLTHEQLVTVFQSTSLQIQATNSQDLARELKTQFFTLTEALKTIPDSIGVAIVMKYPTLEQCEKLHLSPPDLNSFIDNVLQSVYDFSNNRSLIFSSFNPQVCTIMNWKQPNYGVFYRTYCGFDSDTHEPIKSIKSSIKFCKGCDLLGVVCDARAFSLCPELIQTVKESGLLFVTFGDGDMDTLVENGVDAVIQNGVFQYKTQ